MHFDAIKPRLMNNKKLVRFEKSRIVFIMNKSVVFDAIRVKNSELGNYSFSSAHYLHTVIYLFIFFD